MDKFDLTELYTQRLVILIEDKPLSDKYRQVVLNYQQFAVITKQIAFVAGKNLQGNNAIMPLGNATVDLPECFRSHYGGKQSTIKS